MTRAPFDDVEDSDNRRDCGCRPDQECAECGHLSEHWLFEIRCDTCGERAEVMPSLNDPKRLLYLCPNGHRPWELDGCIKVYLDELPLETPGILVNMILKNQEVQP